MTTEQELEDLINTMRAAIQADREAIRTKVEEWKTEYVRFAAETEYQQGMIDAKIAMVELFKTLLPDPTVNTKDK